MILYAKKKKLNKKEIICFKEYFLFLLIRISEV